MTESIQPQPLQIDIVSDVVCPWCIIGYKQFEKALAQLPGQFEVSLDWRPFELNPDTPRDGQDLREHVMQKYSATAEQSDAVRAEQKLWPGRDISAAPTFVFNQQYMVQGAQGAKIFVQVLSRVKDEFQKTP